MKIYSLPELEKITADLRKQGKQIVTTNGVFDILHIGHIRSFEQAKTFGNILVVGINSDVSVKIIKGDKRPIIPQQERAEMLAALNVVDYITIFDETEPSKFIAKIKPSVHIKGKDWEHKHCPEREVVEGYGGRMEFIDLVQGFSTTNLVKKILESYNI